MIFFVSVLTQYAQLTYGLLSLAEIFDEYVFFNEIPLCNYSTDES